MKIIRCARQGAGLLLLALTLAACATPESSQRAIDNFNTTRISPSG